MKKKKKKNPYRSPYKSVGINPHWFLNGRNASAYDDNQHLKKYEHDDRYKSILKFLSLIFLVGLCACDQLSKHVAILNFKDDTVSENYQTYNVHFANQFEPVFESHMAPQLFPQYVSLRPEYKFIDDNHYPAFGSMVLVAWAWTNKDVSPLSIMDKPDLRDAIITIKLRGDNFKANGSQFIFWIESQINPEVNPKGGCNTTDWKRANWGYTGFPLTDYLNYNNWHTVVFTVSANPASWTFAGNNPAQGNCARYAYAPLDQCLKSVNVDIIFILTHVNKSNMPTGRIEIESIKVRYK